MSPARGKSSQKLAKDLKINSFLTLSPSNLALRARAASVLTRARLMSACGVRSWSPGSGLSAHQLGTLVLLFTQYPPDFPDRFKRFASYLSLRGQAVTEHHVEAAVAVSDPGAFAPVGPLQQPGVLGPVAFPTDCRGRRLVRCLKCSGPLE